MISLDEQIKLNVIDQLKWDSRVEISGIDVAVCGGTVKLKGNVPGWKAYRAAQDAAPYTRGVVQVHNNLVVG